MPFQVMPIGNKALRLDATTGESWVLETEQRPYKWVKTEDEFMEKINSGISPAGLGDLSALGIKR